jgi:hypothetical protein
MVKQDEERVETPADEENIERGEDDKFLVRNLMLPRSHGFVPPPTRKQTYEEAQQVAVSEPVAKRAGSLVLSSQLHFRPNAYTSAMYTLV